MKKIFFALFALCVAFNLTIFAADASKIDMDIRFVNVWRDGGVLSRDIAVGSVGRDVIALEYLLFLEVHDVFPSTFVTGHFTEETEKAVRSFQKKHNIKITGVVDKDTREKVNNRYFLEICPPNGSIHSSESLSPVGKNYVLPSGYIPKNLVNLQGMIRTTAPSCLEKETATKLKEMFDAAKKDDITLAVTSAFRKFEIQEIINRMHVQRVGSVAYDFSARAGRSEHQLGTTVDLTGSSVAFRPTTSTFANSKEKEWLKENAHKFGFVMSYPQDSKDITGYIYEPWHWRYIGVEHAQKVKEKEMILIEYLESISGKQSSLDSLLNRISTFVDVNSKR